jgi:[acyl-carrier-protein] S-malonyltransferase
MSRFNKIAFLFPGQGSQYPGMAKDFVEKYSVAKQTFEEADDLLGRKLSEIVFNGPDTLLTETKNSQLGIYVASYAILQSVLELIPELKPSICAGLSLGEYTALTAAKKLAFADGIPLVGHRGQYMNDACEKTQGTMAVVLGLDADSVEQMVEEIDMPNDLWAANFNCPGQVVISGTIRGIEAGTAAAKAKGAKRVLQLQVHGAFHSGLMRFAEEQLRPYIEQVKLNATSHEVIMNVPGATVTEINHIKHNMIKQVTHPVRWEQGIRHMAANHVDLYIEFGCGKTLAGFNKRIGVYAPTVSIEKIEDLKSLESILNGDMQ